MKINQIFKFFTATTFFFLVTFNFQVFAEKISIDANKLIKEWHYLPVKPGKISNKKVRPEPDMKMIFNSDNTFSYNHLSKNISITGSWKIDANAQKLILFRNDDVLREFKILRLNDNELVLMSGENGFVYRSSKASESFFTSVRGLLGILVLIFIVFIFSNNKKRINWYIPFIGLVLQFILAFSILKIPAIRTGFGWISSFFVHLLQFTDEGARFVFGSLVDKPDQFGIIFAFKILPTVIFFSAFTSLLYYFGILQKIVWVFAWVMSRLMKLSGAESLAAAANIFIGQTEAPLVIKPYLSRMSESEILALMTGGMATIAGGVMAAYISFLGGPDPEQQKLFATHLLTASIMNAPASLYLAKILFPETGDVNKDLKVSKEVIGSNVLDSLARGTTDGLKLAVNVGAMLLVFTAMMALLNYIVFHWIGNPTGLNELIAEKSNGQYSGLNLQFILGMVFSPVAWLIGVSSTDLVMVGQLLGEKTILNEFFAFTSMSGLKNSYLLTNPKSIIIATYALCGFANFASIGIQLGGIGALAPNQRITLSKMAMRALLGGTVASLLSASIVGLMI